MQKTRPPRDLRSLISVSTSWCRPQYYSLCSNSAIEPDVLSTCPSKTTEMPATGEVDVIVTQDIVEDAASNSDATISEDDEFYVQREETTYKVLKKEPVKKTATYESLPNNANHEEFIRKSVEILLKDAVFNGTLRENKVLEWCSPEEMMKKIDFNLHNSSSTHEELHELLKDTIKYSVKTGHPYFVNQLFSSLDPYGLVGQWLTDALNPSIYTYEVSPVLILMEEVVLREMRKIVGFEGGRGDGIFCPGGSLANGYAINCARYKMMPEIKVRKSFI